MSGRIPVWRTPPPATLSCIWLRSRHSRDLFCTHYGRHRTYSGCSVFLPRLRSATHQVCQARPVRVPIIVSVYKVYPRINVMSALKLTNIRLLVAWAVGWASLLGLPSGGAVCTPGFELVPVVSTGELFCESGWTKMSQKCVRFFEEYVDWPTAQSQCAGLGGSLAYARDEVDHDVLVDLWMQRSAASTTSYAWVGVTDSTSEGSWTTIDGQSLVYLNWCPNQPDNGANEDCVHLRSGYGSSDGPCYNDNVCSGGSLMHYFCEVDAKEQAAGTACVGCLPGYVSSNGTTCVPCPPGKYTGTANATACTPCGSGKQSFRGDTACYDIAEFLAGTGCVCSGT